MSADATAGPTGPVAGSWGDRKGISDARKAELAELQRTWDQETEHGERRGPYDDVQLSGADVFWLAACALAGADGDIAAAEGQLRAARDDWKVRFTLDLSGLHLAGAILREAHLERAVLSGAHLAGASLGAAHLEGAVLSEAHLERAVLYGAHLERANLDEAPLERAVLTEAHLEGAVLYGAHLERVSLRWAHLEGADLTHAYLEAATDLTDAWMSDNTGWLAYLLRALRHLPTYGSVSLADVRWNGVDLTAVDWSRLRTLGDERTIHWWWSSRKESERALRANIQLAKHLDNAGLKDDADRFFYRAQVCRRGVHLLRGQLLRWLFSWLLYVIAGYGYRPVRSVMTYVLVIVTFATAYFALAPAPLHLTPAGALVTSMVSFHGRGFFPGQPEVDGLFMRFVAAEALCGLLIEITFIATFTQRFFAR